MKNWPAIIAHYFGLSRNYPVRFRTRSRIAIKLDTYHDLVTAWVVVCRNEYHIPTDATLIVDVGANIGLFTLYATATAPKVRVVAVEPFPLCFCRLSAAVAENRLDDRVTCWPLALANTSGTRFMSDSVSMTQSNGLLPSGTNAQAGAVRVEAITLTDLIAKVRGHAGDIAIDFLKIDVEGAEHEFLTGLHPGALDGVSRIGIEYHPNGDKASLFEALVSQGLLCVHDLPFGPNVGIAHFSRKGLT